MNIGPVIRRRRMARDLTLQSLADKIGTDAWPSHLSRIELGKVMPSFPLIVKIARALDIEIVDLIEEAETGRPPEVPLEISRKVPLIDWKDVPSWSENPAATRLTDDTHWVTSPRRPKAGWFAMRVRDDSMTAGQGVSFCEGAYIIVDPNRKEKAGDFVIAIDGPAHGEAATFRQILSDGPESLFRALNPSFPSRMMTSNARVAGVVIGQVLDLTEKD